MTNSNMEPDKLYPANPNYASTPGEIFAGFLEDRELSLDDAAEIFQIPYDRLEWIVNGEIRFPDSLAARIEELYHVPAVFWRNLEENYRRVYGGYSYNLDSENNGVDVFVDAANKSELQLS